MFAIKSYIIQTNKQLTKQKINASCNNNYIFGYSQYKDFYSYK